MRSGAACDGMNYHDTLNNEVGLSQLLRNAAGNIIRLGRDGNVAVYYSYECFVTARSGVDGTVGRGGAVDYAVN